MILLDYKDSRPIYEQVSEKLKELMICGALEQDSQLPSVRTMATDLSINPNTIQRAYAELERQGFIYSVKGKGSFVADTASIRSLKSDEMKKTLKDWVSEAKRAGLTEEEAHGWVTEAWTKEQSGQKSLADERGRTQYMAEEVSEHDKSRESDKTV